MERLLTATAPDTGATLPAALFHCQLDGQPDHLVPEGFLRAQAWEDLAGRQLFLNPRCRITRGAALPPHVPITKEALDKFALQDTIVWISDPGSGALLPFWLGSELGSFFADVKPGDPAPARFPRGFRGVLAMAGVLVDADYVFLRRQEWSGTMLHCGAQFRQHGFAPMAGLIHPFHVAALRRYYRYLIRTGALRLGDHQTPLRYVAHNESVARFFHHQLTPVMSAIAGVPVKPSYVYVGSYLPGAILKKHTDREQCEFSITFCLDYSPEPERKTPWPLLLESPAGTIRVYQAIGDTLFYRGCELAHYRGPLPSGNTSTSIFFHYVPEDFAGSLD
jgi:hypothetical protein